MVQQKDNSILDKNLYAFAVNDAYRFDGFQNPNAKNAGMNPPNGSVINYYVKNISDSAKVSIDILDKNKKLIKTFSTNAKEKEDKIDVSKGMNQFVWNMIYPPAEKAEGLDIVAWNSAWPQSCTGTIFL